MTKSASLVLSPFISHSPHFSVNPLSLFFVQWRFNSPSLRLACMVKLVDMMRAGSRALFGTSLSVPSLVCEWLPHRARPCTSKSRVIVPETSNILTACPSKQNHKWCQHLLLHPLQLPISANATLAPSSIDHLRRFHHGHTCFWRQSRVWQWSSNLASSVGDTPRSLRYLLDRYIIVNLSSNQPCAKYKGAHCTNEISISWISSCVSEEMVDSIVDRIDFRWTK